MGLDIVEWVMDVEVEFDIELEDKRVEQARTFRDFYVLVCDKLGMDPANDTPTITDPTYEIYDRLRQTLAKAAHIKTTEIYFESPVDDFW